MPGHGKLLWGILLGAVAGMVCGWFFGKEMQAIAWIGEFFLRSLKMMIVPLIVAAVISGIASIGDLGKMRGIGAYTLVYYLGTTALAVFTGLVLVNLIQPGAGVSVAAGED